MINQVACEEMHSVSPPEVYNSRTTVRAFLVLLHHPPAQQQAFFLQRFPGKR